MYDEFYKFTGKPFQLTPDTKFFFDSKSHHRAMAYLRYGLEQGEGFIVITGPVGTGKTMLVHNLFKEIVDREIQAAQLVTTQVDPDDVLRMVCASFGLSHQGLNKATLLHNLEAIARARHLEGKSVLLVVDEAQNLPAASIEELRMLSNFQVGGKALFQTFLLGQEEFKRTLQGPGMEQVRQRIIASYHLDPLSKVDTKKYIEHRLTLVGWKNDPEIEDAVFAGVYDFTNGTPRRINSLFDRLLLSTCLEESHRVDMDGLNAVLEEIGEESSQTPDVNYAPEPEDNPTAEPQQQTRPNQSEEISDRERAMEHRLAALEEEVDYLRTTLRKEQKMLRQAILVQMEFDKKQKIEANV